MDRKATPEQIAQFRELQRLQAELAINLISPERKSELQNLARQLLASQKDKNQVLQVLTLQENLDEQEQRALEGILLTDELLYNDKELRDASPALDQTSRNEVCEIKFINDAHRRNYELAMKARTGRKLPLDPQEMIEQLKRTSKD